MRSDTTSRDSAKRYVDLVYSTALRQIGGDAHLAQDITQTVFTDLARKARALPRDVVLGGWLYRHTCFTAAKALRTEHRRRTREREAVAMNAQNEPSDATWRQVASVLDEAMKRLSDRDRDAVVLRFFERQPLREVGTALGTSEDAARMRVDRALEKLRKFLTRRGVTLSGGALATALTGNAVQAAPVALPGAISTAAITGAVTIAAGSTFNLLNLMSMTKLKAGLLSAAVVVGAGTPVVVQQQSLSRVRAENQTLREQSQQVERLRAENQQLAGLRADADELERLRRDVAELHRLRSEVARLRREKEDATRLQVENARLKESVERLARAQQESRTESPQEAESKKQGIERLNYAKQWMLAFHLFADEHDGVLPTDFAQVSAKYPDAFKVEGMSPDQWEIVYTGKFSDLKEPNKVIVIREKQPWYDPSGRLAKAYGFADGHSEVRRSPDGDFEKWEKERMVPSPAQP